MCMCVFQGPSNNARLLHARLDAGFLPDEAEKTNAHLHLQPAQRVPGGTARLSHRVCNQAQSAAAHLPELGPVPGVRDPASRPQPKVTRRRKTQHRTWLRRVWSAHSDAKQQLNSTVNLPPREKRLPAERGTGKHTGDGQTAGYHSSIQKKRRSACYFGRIEYSTLMGFRDEEQEGEADCPTSELLSQNEVLNH